MSCERLCHSQRQPCPSPWRCSPTFCHFQDGENDRARDKAARHFWEPGLQYETSLNDDMRVNQPVSRLHRVLDWVGNQWDRLNELSRVCVAVFGVALCFAVAVAAVG